MLDPTCLPVNGNERCERGVPRRLRIALTQSSKVDERSIPGRSSRCGSGQGQLWREQAWWKAPYESGSSSPASVTALSHEDAPADIGKLV